MDKKTLKIEKTTLLHLGRCTYILTTKIPYTYCLFQNLEIFSVPPSSPSSTSSSSSLDAPSFLEVDEDGMKQGGVEEDGMKHGGVEEDGMKQDGVEEEEEESVKSYLPGINNKNQQWPARHV